VPPYRWNFRHRSPSSPPAIIGRRYTLDDIAEAHRYADTGHKTGNVAVLIGKRIDSISAGDG